MLLQPSAAVARRLAAGLLVGFCLVAAPAVAQQPRLDVPFVPTPQDVVDRMLEMAEIHEGDYLIDLGSGDGRIPVTAAKRYGIRAYGVDLNSDRVGEANENARRSGVADKVRFEPKNLFETEIKDASVLTMYLFASVNLKLRPRILQELEPGTRVVSHAFDMAEWEPDQHLKVEHRDIYLWIVPARVEGRWTVTDGSGKPFTLDLRQTFQRIGGTADFGGRSAPLTGANLNGRDITFTLDMGESGPRTFSGRVDGDAIKASETSGGPSWSAKRAS